MILILARGDDPHVPHVTRILDARRAPYRCFDASLFPSAATVSIRYDRKGSARQTLQYQQHRLDLKAIRAVWDRARTRPVAGDAVPEENRWAVSETSSRVLAELWECLDCVWLPHRPNATTSPHGTTAKPDAYAPSLTRTARSEPGLPRPAPGNKLHQLQLAGQLGFTVPETLVTNSPEEFLEFYEQCEGEVVFKQPVHAELVRGGEPHRTFTALARRQSAAAYHSIRHEPVVFQKRIPKQLELRVTVVGDRAFAAAIDSQANDRLQVDWRHYPDFGGERYYSVHQLPGRIGQRCVRMVRMLGLCFGAIDLILTPEGDHVFLEVNPNGQWAWVEKYTGLPIAEAIADYLIRAHRK